MNKTTLAPLWWPLMDGPSVRSDRCVVCGAYRPLEQHHVVRRSQGELYRDGKRLVKPTLTLCGMGNVEGLCGRPLCHGLAHENKLHFRYTDRWEWLRTAEPTRYADALEMDGWQPIRTEGRR